MGAEIVEEYKRLVDLIPEIIEISGYRNDFIAKKMGMTPQNFSSKKQRSNWSVDEVEKLMAIVDSEDVEDFLLLRIMISRKDDETIPLSELKKEFGWK